MSAFPENEINDVLAKFRKLGSVYRDNTKRIAALGGAYFASAAEAAAPKGSKTHKRYSTAKANKKIRAPKGSGTVVATYSPGNLSRSMQVLKLRRTKSAVFVGATLAKGGAKGNFSGMRADGYYLHMVEKGTNKWTGKPYFMSTWQRSKPNVERIMVTEFERVAAKFKQENE